MDGKSSWAFGRVVLPSAGRSGLSHCLGHTGSQAAGSKGLAPRKVRLTSVPLAMTEGDRAFDLISP